MLGDEEQQQTSVPGMTYLTIEKQCKTTTIQLEDRTESYRRAKILNRWSDNCFDLYIY